MFVKLSQSEHFLLPTRKNVPSLPNPPPNVLPPPEVAFLDPILKTTWVVLSGGARVWEDNLVLLCNHALGWSPPPHQAPRDKAHALAQRPDAMGGRGWGPVGREIEQKPRGDPVVPRGWKRDGTRHEGCEQGKPGEVPQPRSRHLGTWQPGLSFSCFL